MSLNTIPTKAMIHLDSNAMRWAFLRATSIDKPDTRPCTQGGKKSKRQKRGDPADEDVYEDGAEPATVRVEL
eukprot:4271898-Pyramimonas_sp.AAC.1